MKQNQLAPGDRRNYGRAETRRIQNSDRWVAQLPLRIHSRFGKQLIKVYADSHDQLYERLASMRQDIENSIIPVNDLYKFGDWLDIWLDKYVEPGKSDSKYKTYKSIIENHMKPKAGGTTMRYFTAGSITGILTRARRKGLSETTLQILWSICKRSLRDAYAAGVTMQNVATFIEKKRKP
ncbi:MAG: hypothetical protein P4N59_12250 [Negativicutes bacterium]|nr:hypothetical protein [Negativicutes bacterium]